MAYLDHFRLADDLLMHLQPTVASIQDPFIVSRYTGFITVAGVTVYELAIKEIFCEFGARKHKVLGTFTSAFFDRINGQIQYKTLHENYIRRFGERYVARLKETLALNKESICVFIGRIS